MSRWTRFRTLFGPAPEADVDDELAFHIEMRTRELVERGESEARARQLAIERFGDVERSRRECVAIDTRQRRRWLRLQHLAELRQDVAYALRLLRRSPGFTIVAALTIALGVGANSAIFSVVHGVLLQPLAYADADRLYRVRMVYPDGSAYSTLSAPDFMSLRAEIRVFDWLEAYTSGAVTMLGAGEPREVRVVSISDGLFRLLDLQPVLGRGFDGEEHEPGRNSVAVLDHAFWQRAFGGDRGIVGRRIIVGGAGYTIVGVLAPSARLPADVPGARVPSDADLYLPIEYGAAFDATAVAQRRANYLGVLARAKAGIDEAQINDDLARVASDLQRAFPQTNEGLSMNAISAHELIVGDVRRPLLMLLGAVAVVLLVACVNVAHLMLARASTRQTELAVRAAIGAARGRLIRQLLTEACVLGALGGALGLLFAYGAIAALVAAQPADIPRLEAIALNRPVVVFTFGITLLASLGFGLMPALQSGDRGLCRGVREGSRSSGDRRTKRIRAALVVAEMAMAVVLLTCGGLLVRSLVAMMRVELAFVPDNAVALPVTLYGRQYDTATVRSRLAAFEGALRALPGVSDAAATSVLPLQGPGPRRGLSIPGQAMPANVNAEIGVASVSPAYFRAIGTTVTRGRAFSESDRADTPPVAIVNQAAVRRWFGAIDPIGQRVDVDGLREIVGVVADVRQGSPTQPVAPQLYVPFAQRPARASWIVLRTAGAPLTAAPAIRATIRALDPDVALADFTVMEEVVASAVARPRFYAGLLALFALLALLLAAIGIFGVTSHSVAERTREIGIRLALGAHAPAVLREMVAHMMRLAMVGAVLGTAGALAAGRVLRHQLFGVALVDPPTIAAVAATLIAASALASFLSARRILGLDPATALR
jgi:predicted permease